MPAALRQVARLSGLIVMALGAVALMGWAFGLSRATTVLPGLPPMVPATALALALAGPALWLQLAALPPGMARIRRAIVYALAITVTLIGGLTMAVQLADVPLPYDLSMLSTSFGRAYPSRMPFTTALSLSGVGLALMLGGSQWRGVGAAQLLGLLVTLNGVRILLGFVDEGGAYAIASPTRVALHTAAAMVLLGLGVLCARPREGLMAVATSPGYGGQVFRLVLPAVILLPLVVGALALRGRLAGLFSLGFGLIVLTFANLLVFWWLARALNRSESVAVREAERAHALLALAERRTERLQALRRIDLAIINEHQAVEPMLDVLLDQALCQLGSDAAAVLLAQPGRNQLVYTQYVGFRKLPLGLTVNDSASYLGTALRERRVAGSRGDGAVVTLAPAPAHAAGEGFCAGYAAPIVVEGTITGVLEVAYRSPVTFDAEGTAFLETLAGQGAIALATFRLFTDLERSNEALVRAYDDTLAGWSYALELRDGETRGHTQRVTELTLRLAEAFGIADEELVHIRRGAMLHDIGKLGIPDAVLLKPGRLSDADWVLMRQHPVYAYQWLSPIAYLRPALAIPYCHHERWDGRGYPRGLAGEAIPLPARLFAVVDVWDALCSERPYHPPWPIERVRAYIADHAGSHFDPTVVEVFLQLIDAGVAPAARAAGE